MIPTPQLDEALAAAKVGADIFDTLRDLKKNKGSIGFGDLLTAVLTGNGPILAGIDKADLVKAEIEAVFNDRESFVALGGKLFGMIFDVKADLADATR